MASPFKFAKILKIPEIYLKFIAKFNDQSLSLCCLDGERREDVLSDWRRQIEDVLEFTQDLVECVNNDTKVSFMSFTIL
jgi:hypothetical protein